MEVNTDKDHIHIMFESSPTIQLDKFVNALKSASSRYIRKLFSEELSKFYYKPYFWSRSYFIATVSERNTNIVAKYIKNQGKNNNDKQFTST